MTDLDKLAEMVKLYHRAFVNATWSPYNLKVTKKRVMAVAPELIAVAQAVVEPNRHGEPDCAFCAYEDAVHDRWCVMAALDAKLAEVLGTES